MNESDITRNAARLALECLAHTPTNPEAIVTQGDVATALSDPRLSPPAQETKPLPVPGVDAPEWARWIAWNPDGTCLVYPPGDTPSRNRDGFLENPSRDSEIVPAFDDASRAGQCVKLPEPAKEAGRCEFVCGGYDYIDGEHYTHNMPDGYASMPSCTEATDSARPCTCKTCGKLATDPVHSARATTEPAPAMAEAVAPAELRSAIEHHNAPEWKEAERMLEEIEGSGARFARVDFLAALIANLRAPAPPAPPAHEALPVEPPLEHKQQCGICGKWISTRDYDAMRDYARKCRTAAEALAAENARLRCEVEAWEGPLPPTDADRLAAAESFAADIGSQNQLLRGMLDDRKGESANLTRERDAERARADGLQAEVERLTAEIREAKRLLGSAECTRLGRKAEEHWQEQVDAMLASRSADEARR